MQKNVKGIEIHAKKLDGFFEKSLGLIGKIKPFPIFIKTRFGIHTFGLSFPIDIVILDKNNFVVDLKENLLPNSAFFWNPKFSNVLELPSETVKNKGIEVGKKIELLLSYS